MVLDIGPLPPEYQDLFADGAGGVVDSLHIVAGGKVQTGQLAFTHVVKGPNIDLALVLRGHAEQRAEGHQPGSLVARHRRLLGHLQPLGFVVDVPEVERKRFRLFLVAAVLREKS